MGLVILQRWWRRYLMARYLRKVRELEAQQAVLRKKMEKLEARMRAIDALHGHKLCLDPARSTSDSRHSMASTKLQQEQQPETATSKNRLTKAQSAPPAMQIQPVKIQSPTMRSEQHPPTSPPRYQEAIAVVEKSLVAAIRLANTTFTSKSNAPISVNQTFQQTMQRHLTEMHTNLVAAMQAYDSPDWTTIDNFDEPLPYTLGSLPWKRLMDDWSQGDSARVGELTRWLALALNPDFKETLRPIELECMQPVVLEGFLRLIVPALMQHKDVVVQTKPIQATLLRLQVKPSRP
ncbi:hypothetical protein AeMF1_009489 [Aphanomyces euteiches]|nr:hypothetical protein AeMF1_009489 [Aphanomyces euteiches]KAH9190926.1 hypothetical protein AeNC1_007094 [Aphanomyces euteiches]